MTRWLVIIGVIVAMLAALAWYYRDPLYFMMLSMRVKPDHGFEESALPDAPDYTNESHWAALPGRTDNADFTPPGAADRQAEAEVDVFYVHPTTYIKPGHWNAPLDDPDANRFTDDFVLKAQASVFNGCCKVYVPRYRQATLYSFFVRNENGELAGDGKLAVDTAYGDVEAAFDHFLSRYNRGRPFILAGHSQGAKHLETLLKRRISGSPLRKRMVAAYPVGYYIHAAQFSAAAPDIPVCSEPQQTGCFVTWNTLGPDAHLSRPTDPYVCVNPLTWTPGGRAGHERNLGAVSTRGGNGAGRVEPGAADAQCTDGRLLVTEIRTDLFDNLPVYLGKDNHHLIDYGLFYMNIRENAMERTAAFLGR